MKKQFNALFSDDARFWLLASVVFGIVSFLKGVRFPNLWSATQVQIDYSAGFIKRGLFGQLFSLININLGDYHNFFIVSYAVMAVLLLVLVAYIYGISNLSSDGKEPIIAVFFSSYAITYIAHMVGYLDIPLMILCLLVLAIVSISNSYIQYAAVLLGGVIGVLIHEIYLIAFFPLTILPFVLKAASSKAFFRNIMPALTITFIVTGMVLSISLGRPANEHQISQLKQEIAERTDFPPRTDFFDVFDRSTKDNVNIMLDRYKTQSWWVYNIAAALSYFPTAGIFLFMSIKIARAYYKSNYYLMAAIAIVLISASPAIMQIFGWDLYRWYTLLIFSSFVALAIVNSHCRHLPLHEHVVGPSMRNAIILIIGLNMAAGGGMFDEYIVKTFPFQEHVKFIMQALHDIYKSRLVLPPPLL